MNKKFIICYTIFASLVFTFSILFFSLNIYNEYKTGANSAGEKYYKIGLNINSSAQNDSQSFIKNINNNLSLTEDISSIEVKLNNKIVLAYPNSDFIETSTKFEKYFTTSFESPAGNIEIKCNIYLLKPYSVAYYSKLSFLIVLIITLITIILIIYINISENKSNAVIVEENNDIQNSENSDFDNDQDDSIYISDEEEIFDDTEVVPEDTAFELLDNETSVNDDELGFTEEDIPEDILEKSAEIEEKDSLILPYEELTPVDISNNPDEAPEGLFNPSTGLGWASYLNTRLSSEIERAIANEFDLALFMFELPEIPRTSELFFKICNYLAIQFKFKDLIFEYKDNCIVAIKVSTDLDEALLLSDKIFGELKQIISDNKCYLGISSRSIRMVSAERMLLEAEEALKHAKDDPESPVVAFRVDTDKYKEYMERNQN